MKKQMQAVKDFHEHMNISHPTRFTTQDTHIAEIQYFNKLAENLHRFSTLMESHVKDSTRLLRVHLLTEELAEFIEACSAQDEVKALDALTDLLYVLIGTAVQLGWDLPSAFDEVHRSNMTKTPNTGDQPRLRDKGQSFVAPNLAPFIK